MNKQEEIQLLSVSQVNRLANEILSNLKVRVVGELDERFNTNRGYGIGQLSDSEASIDIYIPGRIVSKIKEYLVPGKKIVVKGKLGIYEPYGKFSLTVFSVEPHGEGVLQEELEKLKRKLADLGYFEEERKKPIPLYPIQIGVVTAGNSAAWSDFKKHVVKGYAGLEISLHDALMQGAYCVDSVVSALDRLEKERLDLIVLTRGGGSLQDLMPFNSQAIVEKIVSLKTPIICAIGHEIDITLADLAADLYVSTPTKAAEVISGQYVEFRNKMEREFNRLGQVRLFYKNLPVEIKNARKRLDLSIRALFDFQVQKLEKIYEKLIILNPQNTLKRGYSITYNKNGKIVREVEIIGKGDLVRTQLHKGGFNSFVSKISNSK